MEETIKQKLVELQKTRSEFWNISSEVANFLNLLIKSSNYKNILELGTSKEKNWQEKTLKNVI